MFTPRRLVALPVAVALACLAFGAQAGETTYAASMDGAQNLPEPLRTPATGKVELRVSADGKTVAYVVAVDKLANVAAADIHLGPATQNGPLVVKLWPHDSGAKKGEFSGVLAQGTFSAADLIGPMNGVPLADFLDELKAGNVYCNVHTNDGADPPNSGPGDYRLGEIRGQLALQ